MEIQLITLLAGILLLGIGLRVFYPSYRCRDWSRHEGEIVESRLRSGASPAENRGLDYRLELEYRFRVGGEEVRGSRIRFGLETSSKNAVLAAMERYPVGKRVMVYYDPKSNRSTLESGTTEGTYFLIGLGAVFFLPSAISVLGRLMGEWLVSLRI